MKRSLVAGLLFSGVVLGAGRAGAECQFDEATYNRLNPDVQAAIWAGWLESGEWHYTHWGRFEGRRFSDSCSPHAVSAGPFTTTLHSGEYVVYDNWEWVGTDCNSGQQCPYYDPYCTQSGYGYDTAECPWDTCSMRGGTYDSGYCVTQAYYNIPDYLTGDAGNLQAGDLLFHYPPPKVVRDSMSFPSPVAAAQRVFFARGGVDPDSIPNHVSACYWGNGGNVCSYQIHNDVSPKAVLGTLSNPQSVGLDLPNGNYWFNVWGLDKPWELDALPGTTYVPVHTTHLGAVKYFVTSPAVAARLTDANNWQIGWNGPQNLYRMAGVSRYIPRSMCSETAAAVAQLGPFEGYRMTMVPSDAVRNSVDAVRLAVRGDLLDNHKVQAMRATLQKLADFDISGFKAVVFKFAADFTSMLGMDLKDLLALAGPALNFNMSGVTSLFDVTYIPSYVTSLTTKDFFRSVDCYVTSFWGFRAESSVQCLGNKFINAYDRMMDILPYQAVNFLLGNSYEPNNRYGFTIHDGEYYGYNTSPMDMYNRLGRVAQQRPCSPSDAICPF